MRATNKLVTQKKAIAKFRLEATRVIIGNLPHTPRHTKDMQHAFHIAELCDQYTLMIVLNWLGTKYGFPIYSPSINSARSEAIPASLPLVSWASLADRYPIHSYEFHILPEHSINTLFDLLDKEFSSSLELIGDVYQHVISHPIAISPDKMIAIASSAGERIAGEFYTPAWVADLAVDQWIATESKSGVERKTILQKKMIDPSCGCGNFLLAALRKMKGLALTKAELAHFASESLYGTDLDGRAIALTQMAILIYLGEYFSSLPSSDRAWAIQAVAEQLDQHIGVSDTLLDACTYPSTGSANSTAATSAASITPPIASATSTKSTSRSFEAFDLVITNPPYISFGARDQETLGLDWQQFLKRRFPASSEYKIRYSSIFQEIGLAMNVTGGQSIFLVPDAFLTGSYYQKLRKHLLRSAQIVSLSELHEKTIPDVTAGRWCLAQYRKRDSSSLNGGIEDDVVLQNQTDPTGESAAQTFQVPLSVLVSKDKERFQLLFSTIDCDIVSACRDLEPLSSVLRGHTGIRARHGQKSVVTDHQVTNLHRPGLVSGSELRAFEINWAGKFIEVDPTKLFAGGFDPRVIANPKILVRQTGDSLIAAVDTTGLYHLNNVHSFVATEKDNLNFLASLLNSKFYRYFYRLKTREHKKALAQIDIETVENMPFPQVSNAQQKEFAQLTDERDAARKEVNTNKIIYELFGLNKAQITHIENSDAARI